LKSVIEACFRAIPFVRRPYFQKDALQSELEAAQREIKSLKSQVQSLPELDNLRKRALKGAAQRELFFALKDDDPRQDRLLGNLRAYVKAAIAKDVASLEIGPSYNPILPKREGYNVRILDHDDQAGLKTKYTHHNVSIDQIEPVDFLWRDGSIIEVLGDHRFDVIVAAHVIEHAPDLIQFLTDCSNVLLPDGHLYLFVPDKRYCFDYFQPISDVAKILGDHLLKRTRHSFESYYRNAAMVLNDNNGAWGQTALGELKFLHGDPKGGMAWAHQRHNLTAYEDAHENYFTPTSFSMIVDELSYHRISDLSLEVLTRPRGCEFLTVLKKNSKSDDCNLETYLQEKMRSYWLLMSEELERIELACAQAPTPKLEA